MVFNNRLDSFIKPISLKEYHKQNAKLQEKRDTEIKNIPKMACYDRYGNLFVPYGCLHIMCEFSPIPSHSGLSVPDYDILLNYDYWSHLKTRSEDN